MEMYGADGYRFSPPGATLKGMIKYVHLRGEGV